MLPGVARSGSGGGIRTPDLWVMSPTSCRCSTPRRGRQEGSPDGSGGRGRPRRPRLPRGRPRSTLRRCAGSRPGSGWDRVGPARSRPRAPPAPRRLPPGPGARSLSRSCSASAAAAPPGAARPRAPRTTPSSGPAPRAPSARRPPRGPRPGGPGGGCPPSAISTARLRSVARRPPAACQPGRLPGAFPSFRSGDARLGEGFPLRCFQRFARPNVATQRCRLPDNWPTSGSSGPVLSYWGQPPSASRRPRRIETALSHYVLNPARVPLSWANSPSLGTFSGPRMRRADIEVPNPAVDVDSWAGSACYPRGSFYPLSHGPSTRRRGITRPGFRPCPARRPRSQAPLLPLRAPADCHPA